MASERRYRSGTLLVRDPDDRSVVGEVEVATSGDIEAALERGYQATKTRQSVAHVRADILDDVAQSVNAARDRFADVIAREGIKTIREARVEVARCVETLRLAAAEARRIGGDVIPFEGSRNGNGRLGWSMSRPGGLAVGITPYNDPLNLVAHKIGAAFALGAPIIIKPHPQTPLSALGLVDAFRASGATESMVQVLHGGGDIADALVRDSRTRIVSFTGGRSAGMSIAHAAGMKRLLLELGGVGVVAVAADADIDDAAAAITGGAFWAAGQNCVHAQRIIVDAAILHPLRDRLVAAAQRIQLGAKRDEQTDMGPMVDEAAARRVLAAVAAAKASGGRVLAGGTGEGTRVLPTWIEGLEPSDPFHASEVFGPVSTLEAVANDDELLARIGSAGDSINAAVFTQRFAVAFKAFERVNAGALIVNDSTDFRIDAMPFGGVGHAGLGREGIADAIAAMSEKKLMVLRAGEA